MSPLPVLPALALGTLCIALGVAPAAAANADRGRVVFVGKQCARCHRPRITPGMGPAIEDLRRPQGAFELAGRMWNHAPAMFTALRQEDVEWPQLTVAEMADLMAYLRADPARDAGPDPRRGQVTLLRKGCLKCHSLRGEGGTIARDLATPDPAYLSAPAWASTIWTHTPRMAQRAIEAGVLFPRFSGDEMGNLVAYLRSAAKSP